MPPRVAALLGIVDAVQPPLEIRPRNFRRGEVIVLDGDRLGLVHRRPPPADLVEVDRVADRGILKMRPDYPPLAHRCGFLGRTRNGNPRCCCDAGHEGPCEPVPGEAPVLPCAWCGRTRPPLPTDEVKTSSCSIGGTPAADQCGYPLAASADARDPKHLQPVDLAETPAPPPAPGPITSGQRPPDPREATEPLQVPLPVFEKLVEAGLFDPTGQPRPGALTRSQKELIARLLTPDEQRALLIQVRRR